MELVTRMTLQVDMYFSIVLLRACWASLVNLSTSVKTTTLNSFWPSLLSWWDPATVLRRPCTTTLFKSHLKFAKYPRMYRVEEAQIEYILVIWFLLDNCINKPVINAHITWVDLNMVIRSDGDDFNLLVAGSDKILMLNPSKNQIKFIFI